MRLTAALQDLKCQRDLSQRVSAIRSAISPLSFWKPGLLRCEGNGEGIRIAFPSAAAPMSVATSPPGAAKRSRTRALDTSRCRGLRASNPASARADQDRDRRVDLVQGPPLRRSSLRCRSAG